MFGVADFLGDSSGAVLMQASYCESLDVYHQLLAENPHINPRRLFGAFATIKLWSTLFTDPLPSKYTHLSECICAEMQKVEDALDFSQLQEPLVGIEMLQTHLHVAVNWGLVAIVSAVIKKMESLPSAETRIRLCAQAYSLCSEKEEALLKLLETALTGELDAVMYPNGKPITSIDSFSSTTTSSQGSLPLRKDEFCAELNNRIQLLHSLIDAQMRMVDATVFDSKAKELGLHFELPPLVERIMVSRDGNIVLECLKILELLALQQQARCIINACDTATHSLDSVGRCVPSGSNTSTESSVTALVNTVWEKLLADRAAQGLPVVPAVVTFSDGAVSPAPCILAQQGANNLDENYIPHKKSL